MPNKIREIRKHKKLSQEIVAERAGTVTDQISKLERGERKLTDEWKERIATALEVSKYELTDASDEPPFTIPVIGYVPGGVPMSILQQFLQNQLEVDSKMDNIRYMPVPKAFPGCLGLDVRGNSMNNEAPEGMTVVFDPKRNNPQELDGKLVIASIDGEETFKRFFLNPLRLESDSTDPSIPKSQFFHEDPESLRIIGKVVFIGKIVDDDEEPEEKEKTDELHHKESA